MVARCVQESRFAADAIDEARVVNQKTLPFTDERHEISVFERVERRAGLFSRKHQVWREAETRLGGRDLAGQDGQLLGSEARAGRERAR